MIDQLVETLEFRWRSYVADLAFITYSGGTDVYRIAEDAQSLVPWLKLPAAWASLHRLSGRPYSADYLGIMS